MHVSPYGQTLTVANMPYLRLSRFMGAGWFRVLWRHVLPNIAGALIVVATLEFGLMVLFEAGLSSSGLGVQPPTASWGRDMLSTGRNYVATAWWLSVMPGFALFLSRPVRQSSSATTYVIASTHGAIESYG